MFILCDAIFNTYSHKEIYILKEKLGSKMDMMPYIQFFFLYIVGNPTSNTILTVQVEIQ